MDKKIAIQQIGKYNSKAICLEQSDDHNSHCLQVVNLTGETGGRQ